MKIFLQVLALAAAAAFVPAAAAQTAPAQPSQGTSAAAATTGQDQQRGAQASAQTSAPSPALTGQPSEAATQSTANTPGEPTPASVTPAGQTGYTKALTPSTIVGQPDGRIGIQDQYSPIGREAAGFHDYILMPAIVIITLIVLGLLMYVIVRYRRAAHPVPSRTTHNTMVEVIWTLLPVAILVVIAVPSIRLLAHQYSPPAADMTIKVIGNQWYWTYQYPDHGIEITSNMLAERADAQPGAPFRTDADGPRQLAVDERMVVPVNRVVKIITTSADVIHSFGIPAFWVKMDAVPGRLNETWFRAERPGIYFGACYELCGARHAYMPIAVEVVSDADFARWVVAKGGHMPGAAPAGTPVNSDSTQAVANQAAQANASGARPEGAPAPTNTIQATGNAALVRERSAEPQ
jgi:cytochrome c oxidase subunit II